MQSHLNRVIAYESSNQGGSGKTSFSNKSNIKEVMNTSAPICISSYIKGSQAGNRPMTKAASRRQASFGHTPGGQSTQFSSANSRRGTATHNNATANVSAIGMISG